MKESCNLGGDGDFELEIEKEIVARISALGLKIKITTAIMPKD